MGSGKTTVGRLLAHNLGVEHIDLDALIETHAGMTINQIFDSHGEIYFRKLEHERIKALVGDEHSFVLSLGGGTPCYAHNHLFLKYPNVVSVYLKTSVETLAARLQNQINSRPLLAEQHDAELIEFIAKHLFERNYYYDQATLKVFTDKKSVEEVAGEIAGLLA